MATLVENANAVASCATAIDAAIVAKGGTLVGGGKLRNAAAGIASIDRDKISATPQGGWLDDEKDHLWITVSDDGDAIQFLLMAGGATIINWGDGNSTSASPSSTNYITHTYSAKGDYRIDISYTTAGYIKFPPHAYDNDVAREMIMSIEWGANHTNVGNVYGDFCNLLRYKERYNGITSMSRIVQNCPALKFVKLTGTKLTTIGDAAFYCDYALENVEFDTSELTAIGGSAFYNCILCDFPIPDTVTSLGSGAFTTAGITEYTPTNAVAISTSCFRTSMLKKITFPTGTTSIPAGVCYNCKFLAEVEIADTVTSIGAYPFVSCSFSSFHIPTGLTSIPSQLLLSCSSLTELTIPASVTSIGSEAFKSCTSLAKMIVLPSSPPTVSASSAFSGLTALSAGSVIVPQGCLSAYQNASNWSTLAAYMVEADE